MSIFSFTNEEIKLSDFNVNYNLNLSKDVSERVGWDYNCMGFAIGTYEWEDLYSFESTDCEEDISVRTDICYECAYELEMLWQQDSRYPKMRIVQSEEELADNEYLIAMRIAAEDFHFMRKMDDGRWFEKCGPNILRECTDTIYNDVWYSLMNINEYDSDIIFLAVMEDIVE